MWDKVGNWARSAIDRITGAPKAAPKAPPKQTQLPEFKPASQQTQPKAGSRSIFPRLEEWAEKPHATGRAIPVGEGPHGEQRLRSGWADPKAWRESVPYGAEVPEPTPVGERLRNWTWPAVALGTIDAIRDPDKGVRDLLEDHLVSPVVTGLEVVNDFNDRIANLRRNRAAEPEFEYETQQGEKFTDADITPYFEVAGRLMTEDQFGMIERAGVEWLDPAQAKLADDVNDQGQPYRYAGYRLPDGSVVPKEQYQPNWVYDALPDGTIFQYADGSEPDEPVSHRQTNAGIWGPKDPRAPWEDRAGNVAFFDEDYDISQSTINELLPWFVDMNLMSSPYYVPKYRYAAAAGRSAPYVQGLRGNTYENDGGLSELGLGTYAAGGMTKAQAIGGTLAPPVDSAMERVFGRTKLGSGQAIGGIEKNLPKVIRDSAFGQWLQNSGLGRGLSAAFTEGVEEVPAEFFDRLEQDSLANYARSGHYNYRTGEMEYDPDSPRGKELPKGMFEAFGSGAVLGAGMGGAKELPAALLRRGGRVYPRQTPGVRIPRTYREDGRSQMPDPDSPDLKPKVERKN